ncbi:MAG: SdpI family protein [Candidatus Woesearchaeota archaeon]
MKKSEILIDTLLVLAVLLSIFFYPYLPAQMATHWDVHDNANGYMSKFWGAFLMPIVMIVLTAMFMLIPKIDPLKKNIDKFRDEFEDFIAILLFFFLVLHLQVLLWNYGIRINPSSIVPFAVGMLFYFIGTLLQKAKRNWFIGIRTPWTLSSDAVWDKTHKLGAILFRIAGILAIAGSAFRGDAAMWFVMVPILSAVLICIIFSYIEFHKLEKSPVHHPKKVKAKKK